MSCFPHFPSECYCHSGYEPNVDARQRQEFRIFRHWSFIDEKEKKSQFTINWLEEKTSSVETFFISTDSIQWRKRKKEFMRQCITWTMCFVWLVKWMKLLYDVINSIEELCTKWTNWSKLPDSIKVNSSFRMIQFVWCCLRQWNWKRNTL